jgi:hypothetical protein
MITVMRQQVFQDLQLAGRSERIQEIYLDAVTQLADRFQIPPDRLSQPQVRDHFLHLKNNPKFAFPSLEIASSGIKFFFRLPHCTSSISISGKRRREKSWRRCDASIAALPCRTLHADGPGENVRHGSGARAIACGRAWTLCTSLRRARRFPSRPL